MKEVNEQLEWAQSSEIRCFEDQIEFTFNSSVNMPIPLTKITTSLYIKLYEARGCRQKKQQKTTRSPEAFYGNIISGHPGTQGPTGATDHREFQAATSTVKVQQELEDSE